jgi:hypothetical protein
LKALGKEAVDGTKSAGKTIYYGTKSAGKAIYHGASDVYNDDIVMYSISSKIPAFTNPIVVASIIANMLLFFIIFLMITPKLAPKNPELTGLNLPYF